MEIKGIEVVKLLQLYCNELPFECFLYDLYKWEVVKCCENIFRIVYSLRNMDLRSRVQNTAVMDHFALSELITCHVHLTVLFVILPVIVFFNYFLDFCFVAIAIIVSNNNMNVRLLIYVQGRI